MKAKPSWSVVLLVALLGTACALPQVFGEIFASLMPSPTPSPTPTVLRPEDLTDLAVVQIVLRYDSKEPEGTFEASVCNLGPRFFDDTLEVAFEANGITYTVSRRAVFLPPERCIDVHPDATFSAFAVTQPGPVDITVQILNAPPGDPPANQTFWERIEVPYISTQPSAEAMERYQECLNHFEGYMELEDDACLDRLPDFPLAERDEIAKRWGKFTAIAPREKEGYLTSWISALRTCTPVVQEYIGIPEGFQVPFLVARLKPDISVTAIAQGATISIGDYAADNRDDTLLVEMMQTGCQPKQIDTWMGATFVHEIVHTLLALYIEKEWHGYFIDILLDDGTLLKGEYPEYIDLFPTALNEGLAYWVDTQFKATSPPESWRCEPDGLVYIDTQEKLPYMPLNLRFVDDIDRWIEQNLPEESVLDQLIDLEYFWRIATAECFWDTLVKEEGRQVIGQVLAQVAAYPKEDTCEYPFVNVALESVVDPATLQILAERFNVRKGVEACTYR